MRLTLATCCNYTISMIIIHQSVFYSRRGTRGPDPPPPLKKGEKGGARVSQILCFGLGSFISCNLGVIFSGILSLHANR